MAVIAGSAVRLFYTIRDDVRCETGICESYCITTFMLFHESLGALQSKTTRLGDVSDAAPPHPKRAHLETTNAGRPNSN